jgi:hypothetical protein
VATNTRLVLDEQGWRELSGRLTELVESASELQAQSADRLHADRSGGDEVVTSLVLLGYEAPPAASS